MQKKRYKYRNLKVTLSRAVYKLLHRRKFHHMAKTVPYLKLVKNGEGWDLYWKNRFRTQTLPWQSLLDLPPSRLYVIGSGPSINEQNLSILSNEACVLLNGAISLVIDGTLTEPYAVMIEDARFIHENGHMIEKLPTGTRLCMVADALHALGEYNPALFERFQTILIDGFETPYGQPRRNLSEVSTRDYRVNGDSRLSLNMALGHFGCGTVMYCGVQLGFYLGAKELYLVGFDMTNLELPRFYETSQNRAWNGLEKAYLSRILPAFKLSAKVAREREIVFENCSHTSIVPRDILPFNDRLMASPANQKKEQQ